jgi:lipoprotein-anchoring transpeptidase ErfK/SrfK
MISLRSLLALCFAAMFVGMISAANAAVLITIDKSTQHMTVAVDGTVRWTWPVSTGSRRYDTPNGNYSAFRMEKDHYSKEWDDAPMPHSIFFTKRGHAIHGSYHTRLGHPVSHGCVRLSPGNAAKLYALVEREGVSNTTVDVTGSLSRGRERRHEARASAVPE